jgi:hypothetical protein
MTNKNSLILFLVLTTSTLVNAGTDGLVKNTSTALLKTELGKEYSKTVVDYTKKNLPTDPATTLVVVQFLILGDITFKTGYMEFKIELMKQKAAINLSTDF